MTAAPAEAHRHPQVAYSYVLRAAGAAQRLDALAAELEGAGAAVARTHEVPREGDRGPAGGRTAADGGGSSLGEVLPGASTVVRDLLVRCADEAHASGVVALARGVAGVTLESVRDVVMAAHDGGKLRVESTVPVRDREDLATVYTPGVARVCLAVHADPAAAYDLTIKANSVAIVTDGSAVLGLGDLGPLAALPVMEGKALLLKELAGVDAYPLCLDERDPDRLVDLIAALATGFGGINLEDIAAPRCFEVEGKLRRRLDIPVFHDDQHGTAVVVLAALHNAVRVVGKTVGPDLRVVVQGIGAAGVAITNLLMAAGVTDVVGVDRGGIVTARRREARDPIFRRLGRQTNPRGLDGPKEVALAGADVFVGVSSGGSLSRAQLDLMAPDAIVFAMANPTPEIDPELAIGRAAVVATGRSDYPNQINNVLCFPGLFRGLLDARARAVSDATKLAAARAIAGIVADEELGAGLIIPSPLDRRVVPAVAAAVAGQVAAEGAGMPAA